MLQSARVIAKADHANSFLRGCNQHLSQGAFGGEVVDANLVSAVTIASGRHPETGRGTFVGAAVGTVAGGVHGSRGRWSVLELMFEPAKAAGIGVGAGRNTEGALEDAL